MLVPNDVTVIPTYVELRRPTYEAKPIPEQWRGNAEKEAQWVAAQDIARAAAELAGPVTPTAPTAGSVIGHADLSLPNSLGFQGRFQAVAGNTPGISFFKNPACELWDRQNDELFRILYHTCKNVAHSLLQQLRPVDGSGDRGNGQEAFNILRNRYEGRSGARERSLLTEMQSCTLQPGEDPGVHFARLYRVRLQLQVGCTVDDYQLKANAPSGLSAEYVPMLIQLRTMQSLHFTMVNDMLREVYVNDVLLKKDRKDPLRGYRSEAAMTTTTEKRSGMNRDVSEVICHSCKEKGHYTNKCPADKPLSGDTTTKCCSLHKTRSHSDDDCMAQQKIPQSSPPGSALAATTSPTAETTSLTAETCSFTFVASSSFSSIKKGGLQLLVDSGCSSHMVDPATIPNAEQHPRKYQELRPPQIVYVAGSHELLETGTATLKPGVNNTGSKQREVNMTVSLVPGLSRQVLSSSAALANGVETIISSFPRLLAKAAFPLRADSNLYFLDAVFLERPECDE